MFFGASPYKTEIGGENKRRKEQKIIMTVGATVGRPQPVSRQEAGMGERVERDGKPVPYEEKGSFQPGV